MNSFKQINSKQARILADAYAQGMITQLSGIHADGEKREVTITQTIQDAEVVVLPGAKLAIHGKGIDIIINANIELFDGGKIDLDKLPLGDERMIEDWEISLDELIEEFYSDVQTESVFNCTLVSQLDWNKMNEPVTIRPIPSAWYSRKKVIYAVRHYNKVLPIVWGDMTFSPVGIVLNRKEEGERMSKTVCPLCGSEIIVHIPPYHLRGTPYGHKVTLTCSNEDCRPVDSRMFGEDYGMTFAVTSFYVTDEYYGLSDDDRRCYDEMMKEHYASVIRKKFIDRRTSE